MDVIKVDNFDPRPWQIPLINAFERDNFKRIICVIHRRAGKDIAAWNLCVREAIRRPGINIYYFLPTFSHCRRTIWEMSTNEGHRVLDHYIPKELIASKNSSTMQIRLTNGSLIALMGSNSIDRIVGTNPTGVVFSEYALCDERAWQLLIPVLRANQGWAIFLGTPRGRNHFFQLYENAKKSPDWYTMYLNIDDTKIIDKEVIDKDIEQGILSWDYAQQEFYCSWNFGISGSFWGESIDRMRLDERIGDVPWLPEYKVNVSFDLGWDDDTVLLFYQIDKTGNMRIIDHYQKNNQPLEHYVNVINSKPYSYNKFILPHDVKVHELNFGISRLDRLAQLGIKSTLANALPFHDGIEEVRASFNRMYIDEKKCANFIKSLENYRRKYDEVNQVYSKYPVKDRNCHSADALRYACVSLNLITDKPTSADYNAMYYKAKYGNNSYNIAPSYIPGFNSFNNYRK